MGGGEGKKGGEKDRRMGEERRERPGGFDEEGMRGEKTRLEEGGRK